MMPADSHLAPTETRFTRPLHPVRGEAELCLSSVNVASRDATPGSGGRASFVENDASAAIARDQHSACQEKAPLTAADCDFSPLLLAEWLETTLAAAEQDMVSLERACSQVEWPRLDNNLMECCATLEQSLGKLNFKLLDRRGWAARFTGTLRRVQHHFGQQWRDVRVSERRLNAASLLFLQRHLARQSALKATVLDLQLNTLRVHEMLETAQRCLETLSSALGDQSTDGAQYRRITDAQARLSHLQIVSSIVGDVTSSARRSFEGGNALIEALQWRWVAVYSQWQAGMKSLEEELQTSETPLRVGDEHQRGQLQLILWLRSFRDSCAAYQRQEELLANQLETLNRKCTCLRKL